MIRALTIFIVFSVLIAHHAIAQDSTGKRRIAVLAPLYLDTLVDANGKPKFDKTVPTYLLPGLDVVSGLQLAVDSLQKDSINLDIKLWDIKDKKYHPSLLGDSVKNIDVLIGYVSLNEAAMWARYAKQWQIPFINLNQPNDAGVTGNPYYYILNPTLGTHVSNIYKHLQKNHPLQPIVYFKKIGAAEDKLLQFFQQAERSTSGIPLKIKYVTLTDTLSADQLERYLDSTKNTVCISGSLDLKFGATFAKQLASLSKKYKATLVGMPNWESIDFSRAQYRGIDIVYGLATHFSNDNLAVQYYQKSIKSKYFVTGSETVLRTFETVLLTAFEITQPAYKKSSSLFYAYPSLFGSIDWAPVKNSKTGATDFIENKKVVFIKKTDGTTTRLN
ncbi:MAG: hypothetical protein K2P88_13705 [Chitinophagaceae bacterium]|uniref:hypothetical protein n=1 Tax=unclassified Paraflavitalea TaxID=2798305 RepID=UPI003D335B83|nr:hypothetical protein [Chitinophagaceae bacterium]